MGSRGGKPNLGTLSMVFHMSVDNLSPMEEIRSLCLKSQIKSQYGGSVIKRWPLLVYDG